MHNITTQPTGKLNGIKLTSIIVQLDRLDTLNNKILLCSIQAESGLGKKKWKLLRTQIDEILYKYKFPKIIYIDTNADEKIK